MTKSFFRPLLAAFAAAGVAGAQTPPPSLTPTGTPPMPAAAPVQQVAFKVMPQPAAAAPVKAVPPAAKPNEAQCVRVQVRLITLPVGSAAVRGLFAADRWRVKPEPVSMTAGELSAFLERIAGDRRASVMQAPRMNHFDRQPMDFRTGDDLWFGTDRRAVRVFVGTACRMKPTVAADGKSVELAVDFTHTERDGGAEWDVQNLKTLAVKDTFSLPVGGSAAVRLGTRTVTTRTEFGPPVLSDIPYLNRMFKNVGVGEVVSDVVALFTVEGVMPPDDESFVRVTKLEKPAPAKLYTKVFDVTDLVCPPTDSPLAKPGEDVAMQAAVKGYTSAKAEQLMKQVRDTVTAASWEENGGSGKMAFYANGQSLVVNGSVEVLTHVGECLTSMREMKCPPVFVQMVVLSAKSEHPAVRKLLDTKRATPLTPEEVKAALIELKNDGAADILSRPQLMLRNKQTGFFQTGQQFPRLSSTTPAEKGSPVGQQVEYVNTGLVVRMTPDVSADGKFVRLTTEVSMTEPSPSLIDLGNGIKAQPIDCQAVESTLVIPDGGTMAMNVGTKKVEQRIEHKVPVLGDLPYVGRLFRNVGVTHERRDTIVVATATRMKSEDHLRTLTAAAQAKVSWSIPAPPVALPPMAVAPPMAKPVAERVGKIEIIGNTTTQQRVILNQLDGLKPGEVLKYLCIEEARKNLIRLGIFDEKTPPTVEVLPGEPGSAFRDIRVTVKETKTGMISLGLGVNSNAGLNGSVIVQMSPPVTPIPMPIHNPLTTVPPAPPQVIREVMPDGLERIGVDFHLVPASGSVPVTGRIAGAGRGGIPAGDETAALMKSYRAACAAGKKDEASRLALQLLAKDPTCFGRDR